jgi:hypothetical protein
VTAAGRKREARFLELITARKVTAGFNHLSTVTAIMEPFVSLGVHI